jgi:initiation factor 1A
MRKIEPLNFSFNKYTGLYNIFQMPNLKGGKKYKSGKHSDDKPELYEINEEEGQSIGRVIKTLGDRNMLLYCNDCKERIAHIRGGLSKKKGFIEIGDIVLYSLRGDGMSNGSDRGDILAKYDRDLHSLLKKQPGVNGRLFTTLETLDVASRAKGTTPASADCGFDFENDTDSEGDNEGDVLIARAERKALEEKKRAAARDVKHGATTGNGDGANSNGNDNIDIDAI